MKIIYMGTPDFAVGPLEALLAGGHEVVLVLTQTDRPKGRGHQLQAPPVKEAALKAGRLAEKIRLCEGHVAEGGEILYPRT